MRLARAARWPRSDYREAARRPGRRERAARSPGPGRRAKGARPEAGLDREPDPELGAHGPGQGRKAAAAAVAAERGACHGDAGSAASPRLLLRGGPGPTPPARQSPARRRRVRPEPRAPRSARAQQVKVPAVPSRDRGTSPWPDRRTVAIQAQSAQLAATKRHRLACVCFVLFGEPKKSDVYWVLFSQEGRDLSQLSSVWTALIQRSLLLLRIKSNAKQEDCLPLLFVPLGVWLAFGGSAGFL